MNNIKNEFNEKNNIKSDNNMIIKDDINEESNKCLKGDSKNDFQMTINERLKTDIDNKIINDNNNIYNKYNDIINNQILTSNNKEGYSYECTNLSYLTILVYKGIEKVELILFMKNNGTKIWEKDSKLINDPSSNLATDALNLIQQKPNEELDYRIIFKNLKGYPPGEYKTSFLFYTDGRIRGERIEATIKINEKKDNEENILNINKIKNFLNLPEDNLYISENENNIKCQIKLNNENNLERKKYKDIIETLHNIIKSKQEEIDKFNKRKGINNLENKYYYSVQRLRKENENLEFENNRLNKKMEDLVTKILFLEKELKFEKDLKIVIEKNFRELIKAKSNMEKELNSLKCNIKEMDSNLKKEDYNIKIEVSKFPFKISENENLIQLIIMTIDENIIFPILCKNTNKFIEVVNIFYEEYPQYHEYKGKFYNYNKILDENKTVKECELKNKDIIIYEN